MTDLDADQDALVPDHFNKGDTFIGVLVQSLVEEDDASDAAVDAIICTEEDLTVLPAVFLRVFYSNLGQPLSNAACSKTPPISIR